ncbi:MAG: T9SS type A sorting domain-containing protein [Candidatus Krumholzibacteriota bacterium]|nr:T9SS type A sorting domain-containing protein [Candidatus Krumholzibacteriota bacterium]
MVNKFCPSLVMPKQELLHWGINTCPEPVEIVTSKLYRSSFFDDGYKATEDCTPFFSANYSYIDNSQENKRPGLCYDSENCGMICPPFPVIYHFDYAGVTPNNCSAYGGVKESPSGWYGRYASEAASYPHTVYAHPFVDDSGEYVIQYWFFYPFNDWLNNHEGDWEHINVTISSDDPQEAEITRVIYFFHHCYRIVENTQNENPSYYNCFVVDGSHPVVFVGGYSQKTILGGSGEGWASHGSYPFPTTWYNVKDYYVDEADDFIEGDGQYVSWCDIVSSTSADGRYGVVLLKEPGVYDYDERPEMSWLKADIRWGHLRVASFYDDIPTDVGNGSPDGPFYQATWNHNLDTSLPGSEAGGATHPYNLMACQVGWDPPANPAGEPRDLFTNYSDGSTVFGYMYLNGTAEWTDDNIVLDWKHAEDTEWSEEGIEMTLWMGPFVDFPYARWNTYAAQNGPVTLRARVYNDGSLIAQETLDVIIESRSRVVAQDGSGDFTTIQAGIDWCEPGDTLFIAGPANYQENISLKGSIFLVATAGNVEIVGIQEGATAELTCYDYPCFLQGLTLKHQSGVTGSGLYVENGKAVVTDCVLKDNNAPNGAGAWIRGDCEVRFERCVISNNTAHNGIIVTGGVALHIESHNCVHEGTTLDGHPVVSLVDCDIIGNCPISNMGGPIIYCGYHCSCTEHSEEQPYFENCRICGNSNATYTINFLYCYQPILKDCIIANNGHRYTNTLKGAIMCLYSGLELENCTIVNNQCPSGTRLAGIRFYGYAYEAGTRIIKESVIAYNHGPAVGDVVSDMSMTDCDLFGNVSEGAWGPADTEWLAMGTNVINENPLFCDATGGIYTLFAHSPCVGGLIYSETIGAEEIGCVPQCEITAVIKNLSSEEEVSPGLNNTLFGCPQGDGGFALVVKLNFDEADMVGTDLLSQEIISLDLYPEQPFIFWGPNEADSSAAGAYGYTTTITDSCISAVLPCQSCDQCPILSVNVLCNGEVIGYIDSLIVKSPDFTGDGTVDLSDLSFLGDTYCKSRGEPGYIDCLDFNGDGEVNLSELSFMGNHYNHSYNPLYSSGACGPVASKAEVLLDVIRSDNAGGEVLINVWLANVSGVSAAALGFRELDSQLAYSGWDSNPEFPGIVGLSRVSGKGGDEIFITALNMDIKEHRVKMGTLRCLRKDGAEAAGKDIGITLSHGELLTEEGNIQRICGVEIKEALLHRNCLEDAYPNPFNPSTTIGYSILKDAHVNLSVFNVSGQLVRTLVDENQARNSYRVVWDGKNNRGKVVSSGVYFYRIEAGDFVASKKLVLFR